MSELFSVQGGFEEYQQFGNTMLVTQTINGVGDPSQGVGVSAPIGTHYKRNNGTVGELWLKYGNSDTDWRRTATDAYVDGAVGAIAAIVSQGTRWRPEIIYAATSGVIADNFPRITLPARETPCRETPRSPPSLNWTATTTPRTPRWV